MYNRRITITINNVVYLIFLINFIFKNRDEKLMINFDIIYRFKDLKYQNLAKFQNSENTGNAKKPHTVCQKFLGLGWFKLN